ncbi:hypothetical protein JCM3770_001101 [Rhodotorula araucariae]
MHSQSPSAWLAPSPASALAPVAPSPFALAPASPAAASLRPPRRPLSARPPLAGPSTQGGAASTAALHSADPVSDARRALGVLLGIGDGEGLLDRVQRDVDALLTAYDRAFDPDSSHVGRPGAGAAEHALDSLNTLIALLARSSAGGFVPSAAGEADRLTQAHLDRAGDRAQALFRQGQRASEAAEVVRAGLSC